ncbi:MAG: hypothetical protein AAFQ63_11305 [Cyanobacteria bacterium J06621_11]
MTQISQQSIRDEYVTRIAAPILDVEVADKTAALVTFVDAQSLPFSWVQIAEGLISSSEFRARWNQTWADLPFDFEWKPVPIHPYTAQTHAFFAIAFPANFRSPDPTDFLSHLQDLPHNQLTAQFSNFSGDAQLLVPQVTGEYGHIAAFCRTAGTVAMHELWQKTGELCMDAIARKKAVWCNTHGHGVPWLHVRFDKRLKYASFPPRGSISANSQAIWYQQIYYPILAIDQQPQTTSLL